MKCRICNNNQNNSKFQIREMMFGFNEVFDYFKCFDCGCLQISEIPKDVSKYYPEEYYSFKTVESYHGNTVKSYLKRKRYKHYIGDISIIGFVLNRTLGSPELEWIKHAKISETSTILDVGCGAGQLLLTLRAYGFKKLIGIDPYIGKELNYDGLKILKKTIDQVDDQFDFIMLHHSLEHMDDQHKVIKKLNKILKPKGELLVRIPLVSSFAWDRYKENWVDLDAPRHFYLHTVKSFDLVAKNAGFFIDRMIFDSTDFQFWGSEQYQNNISLRDSNSYAHNPKSSIFTKKQIKSYRKMASKLNEEKRGDQACFFLRKDDLSTN